MLSGEKILITGPAGKIAFPVARALAQSNEVWGIARFSNAAQRDEVESAGVTTRTVDLADPDFSDLPRDFTRLVHIAVAYEPTNYDHAITINAEGTGLLLSHCRNVKSAIVFSTNGVYKPHPDPWHAFREDDPLGDMLGNPLPYSTAKISQEAVARFCAREFDIPVTIARMNSAYGPRGGLPVSHIRAVAEGRPIETRWDPCPYSPIHDDDIVAQVGPLLMAATTPATIVNWCGDEGVSMQQWCAYAAELLGTTAEIIVKPVDGDSHGQVADPTRRKAITGACRVHWRDGFRRVIEELYPDRVQPGTS
jgi:nucleoside-diphosphate-sugar epimerase